MQEVIINKMFAGDYWDGNLGHESINLIVADNGEHYIYVQPYGDYSVSHGNIKSVVLVRGLSAHEMEILGVADVSPIPEIELPNNYSRLKRKPGQSKEAYYRKLKADTEFVKQKDKQNKFAQQVTYGEQSLANIFKSNKHDDISFYVTFKADSFKVPTKRIILCDSQSAYKHSASTDEAVYFEVHGGKAGFQFAKSSLKMYVPYFALAHLFEQKQLWQEDKKTIYDMQSGEKGTEHGIFSIINKLDDELVASDMLAYYFGKYNSLYHDFVKLVQSKCADKNINYFASKTIEREKYHIDILIEDEQNVFVIENKINSDINGKKIDADHNGNNNKKYLTEDGKICSQLSNYYNIISKMYSGRKNVIGVTFVPNHNVIDLDKYYNGDKYVIITYKELHQMFVDNDQIKQDKYYEDFISVLKRHSETNLKDILYRQMVGKMKERIEELEMQ